MNKIEVAVTREIAEVMQDRSLSADSKMLLIGMASCLSADKFMQILDRLNTINQKLCVPLDKINHLAVHEQGVSIILDAVVKLSNNGQISSEELEAKLVNAKPKTKFDK